MTKPQPDKAAMAYLFQRTVRLLAAGDPDVARLLPQLERFPDYAPGWLAIAETLLQAKQIDAAKVALRRAVQGTQAVSALLHLAGQRLAQLGERQDAIAAFHRALARDGSFPGAWYSLGLALQDDRRFAEAAAAYGTALRLQPGFHEAAFNLAISLQQDGQLEQALDAYATALQIKPDSFGRIAQALISGSSGALWLRPTDLRLALTQRMA
jgi:tetratricopeptide (TPR) repeat protein